MGFVFILLLFSCCSSKPERGKEASTLLSEKVPTVRLTSHIPATVLQKFQELGF